MTDPATVDANASVRQQLAARLAAAASSRSAPAARDASDASDDAAVGRAVAFVLRSTKARPQTAGELRDKLTAREYDAEVIAAAITRATELGAVDDAAFARAWVADRGFVRGYSASRLRRELRGRQVSDALIDGALTQLDGRDELAVATELARAQAHKMPARLEPDAVARRLLGFLARRGYPEGLARRVAIAVSGLDRHWD